MPQTRATTAAIAANKTTEQPNTQEAITDPGEVDSVVTAKVQPSDTATSQATPYRLIAEMLAAIIQSGKLDPSTKQEVVKVIKIAREAESKAEVKGTGTTEQAQVSAIREAILKDLVELHNSLEKKIHRVQEGCGTIIEGTNKVLKEVAEAKTDTKDLTSKVDKVSDATDKFVSGTNSYRDALLAKPPPTSRANADPKVLNDMDRKAKQILVDIFDKEGDNILMKSLTSIIVKANEAIEDIKDGSKPKDIKVVAAFKTRRQAVLLTLNSKEAANWIREPLNEMEFTKSFSTDSHIRERTFNLIAPRVPITLEPSDDKHLHEIEEANSLNANSIRRARWIKPVERRRLEQTHAYAIITLTSADTANILIRDGLYICGTKVRPTKQKQEPIQCMKCRNWGHFASECTSAKDVCGNCGEGHRTSACKNRAKLYCAACKENTHASWSRNCPEFNRRCQIVDGRNPENAMPYFPTEHDWTLTVRPNSMPLEDRFPAKYTVNALPSMGGWQQVSKPHQQRKGQKRGTMDQNGRENPNLIPIPSNRAREAGELMDGGDDRWWQAEPSDSATGVEITDETSPQDPSGWD